jgi:hypothetical protein
VNKKLTGHLVAAIRNHYIIYGMMRTLENIGVAVWEFKMQNAKLKMGVLGTAKMSVLTTID